MGKGIFPQMSLLDIINSLSGWGVSVSQEQLIRPSAESVELVFCTCLQQVTNISQDALQAPVQNALSAHPVDDKDLYLSALTNNFLVYHLTRFAKAARVDDFNSKDIYSPERERTIFLLSAFINFVKFTEEYCDSFVKDLQDRSKSVMLERNKVSEHLLEIDRSIAAIRAKMAEDEPRCEQLREENNTLRAKMIATKEFQTAAVQEVEKLKAEKNTLIKRKEALNLEIASVSEVISRTRSRIVQSPERIKRTIATMTVTAADDKKTIANQEAKARDLQPKIDMLLRIEKDVRSCIEQLQTIEKETGSLQISQKELSDLKDQLQVKNIERTELQLRKELVEKQLSNAHDKLERVQRHAEEKKVSNQRTIARLHREYEEMAIERRDNDRQLEELRAEANEVGKKMAEHTKNSEAELNELLAEYWKLRHETDVYMETLANKLNMRVISD